MNTATWENSNQALFQQAPPAEVQADAELADYSERASGKVRQADVVDVTAQLAIMTKSGVDIATAMGSLATQCSRPALADILQQIRDDVLSGIRFSEALRRHPLVFDEAYVATVASGEATGRMAEVFDQLADLKRSELRLRRTITSLLIYPALLATVSCVVITALITFVLPQFAEIFAQYDTPLPALTRGLLFIANEFRARWWFWIPLAAAAIAGVASLRYTARGRRYRDTFLLRGIGIRDVCQKLIAGRVCRLLGLMIESGVPLLDSLRLVGKSTKNVLYRELMDELVDGVTNGQALTASLKDSELFPGSATEMIGTAERSGKLGEVLRMVGAYLEEEGESSARSVVSSLEPIITVVMGVIVAVVVLSVMLPVFDLATVAKGGY